MVDLFSIYDPDIGLIIFFMHPEITKPFSLVAIEWHSVLPHLRNILIILKDMVSQCKQITFNGFFFFKKVVIDVANNESSLN